MPKRSPYGEKLRRTMAWEIFRELVVQRFGKSPDPDSEVFEQGYSGVMAKLARRSFMAVDQFAEVEHAQD